MNKGAFIFDINKCVGCMACIAGCSIENPEAAHINWRELSSFNALHHPELPVFHFSLACNHCEDSPCMQNCPALAYTRDSLTGAIIHHAESCIGCKYCTWACPYDAPKFNKAKGIVEKCTFCVDRLLENRNPACVDACPVGALSYGENDPQKEVLVPGFVDVGIRPAINLIPLRKNSPPEILNLDKTDENNGFEDQMKPASKVDLVREWSLIPLTLVVSTMVGWFGTHLYTGLDFPLHWFLMLSVLTILFSSFHLAKKTRAWRAILNVKNSWLSREILTLILFIGSGALSMIDPHPIISGFAMVMGVFCLISIDMVYHFFIRPENINTHSAMTLLTGFMVFSLASNIVFLIGFTISVKFSLYLYRKISFHKKAVKWNPIFSSVRLFPLIVALVYIGSNWFYWLNSWMVLSLIGIGEIIDRIEYYREAEVPFPKMELFEHLNNNDNAKE